MLASFTDASLRILSSQDVWVLPDALPLSSSYLLWMLTLFFFLSGDGGSSFLKVGFGGPGGRVGAHSLPSQVSFRQLFLSFAKKFEKWDVMTPPLTNQHFFLSLSLGYICYDIKC